MSKLSEENKTPIQLAYNEFLPSGGVKDEIPILLLHGVTATKEYWDDIPQIVADSTKRKVYALDARNHGDSEWSNDFDFETNVIDLQHFIDQIKAEKVILVGHSMGGFTSMKVALQSPERIEKLVIEDMKVSDVSQQILDLLVFFISLAELAIKKLPPVSSIEKATEFIRNYIYNSLPDSIKIFVKLHSNDHRIILKQNPDGSFSYKSNLDALSHALKKLQTSTNEMKGVYNGPTCFMYGIKSPFQVKQDEPNIRNYFPKAEFVGIEDSFHGIHTDCPKSFTEELLKFLNK